jgi:glycosyltransferase involved in cell wall biosynthesis
MLNILILNANLKGVGTYLRGYYFGRELARQGHDVTLITVARDSTYRSRTYYKRSWAGEAEQPVGDGPWIRMIEGPNLGYKWLPGWGSGPLDIWLRIQEIQRGDYDVVWGLEYQPNVSWPVYLTRRSKRYRFYSDWCDWHAGSSNQFRGFKVAHRIDAFWEERIRFRAAKVTVISRVLQDRAISLGISRDQVVYLPNGAPTDYIRPFPQDAERQRFGLPLNTPILVAARSGDMRREVSVFAQVLQRVPDALFLMIGRESQAALQLATQLGIRERVVSSGWVSDEDYPRYLACADVCFCPLEDNLNNRARWPAKIIDYLSSGRATVTNDVGDVGPLFRQHPIGLLVGQGDGQVAEGIVTLLQEPRRRQFLAEQARDLMVREWDWKIRGRQIAELMED